MDRRSTAAWKMGRQVREGIAKKMAANRLVRAGAAKATADLQNAPPPCWVGDGGSPHRAKPWGPPD
jgi:hypothetical protein